MSSPSPTPSSHSPSPLHSYHNIVHGKDKNNRNINGVEMEKKEGQEERVYRDSGRETNVKTEMPSSSFISPFPTSKVRKRFTPSSSSSSSSPSPTFPSPYPTSPFPFSSSSSSSAVSSSSSSSSSSFSSISPSPIFLRKLFISQLTNPLLLSSPSVHYIPSSLSSYHYHSPSSPSSSIPSQLGVWIQGSIISHLLTPLSLLIDDNTSTIHVSLSPIIKEISTHPPFPSPFSTVDQWMTHRYPVGSIVNVSGVYREGREGGKYDGRGYVVAQSVRNVGSQNNDHDDAHDRDIQDAASVSSPSVMLFWMIQVMDDEMYWRKQMRKEKKSLGDKSLIFPSPSHLHSHSQSPSLLLSPPPSHSSHSHSHSHSTLSPIAQEWMANEEENMISLISSISSPSPSISIPISPRIRSSKEREKRKSTHKDHNPSTTGHDHYDNNANASVEIIENWMVEDRQHDNATNKRQKGEEEETKMNSNDNNNRSENCVIKTEKLILNDPSSSSSLPSSSSSSIFPPSRRPVFDVIDLIDDDDDGYVDPILRDNHNHYDNEISTDEGEGKENIQEKEKDKGIEKEYEYEYHDDCDHDRLDNNNNKNDLMNGKGKGNRKVKEMEKEKVTKNDNTKLSKRNQKLVPKKTIRGKSSTSEEEDDYDAHVPDEDDVDEEEDEFLRELEWANSQSSSSSRLRKGRSLINEMSGSGIEKDKHKNKKNSLNQISRVPRHSIRDDDDDEGQELSFD